MEYRDRPSLDPKVHFEKPCVVAIRILVEQYYLDLEIDAVKAGMTYATELVHAEEIRIGTD